MKNARFYCESLNKGSLEIAGADARHMIKVLRLAIAEKVELFDGKGKLATAQITAVNKTAVKLNVLKIEENQPRKTHRIIIASSIAKTDRFEWLIAKCTELDIDRIIPVIYHRTVKQPKGKNTGDRYKKIAIESAKQSRTNFLPIIDEPQNFSVVIENLKDCPNAKLLFGSLRDNPESLAACEFQNKDIIVFIGPEGGFTTEEEKTLITSNATPVSLTKTVLRIETAAIAAASFLTIKRNANES